jgi:hypothetical protein
VAGPCEVKISDEMRRSGEGRVRSRNHGAQLCKSSKRTEALRCASPRLRPTGSWSTVRVAASHRTDCPPREHAIQPYPRQFSCHKCGVPFLLVITHSCRAARGLRGVGRSIRVRVLERGTKSRRMHLRPVNVHNMQGKNKPVHQGGRVLLPRMGHPPAGHHAPCIQGAGSFLLHFWPSCLLVADP